MTQIAELPLFRRPRERLLSKGSAVLDDAELMAVIIGRGVRGASVLPLAKKVIQLLKRNPEAEAADLLTIHGIGPAAAARIEAAMEFTRRKLRSSRAKILRAEDILPHVRHIAARKREHLLCATLNGALELIEIHTIAVGSITKLPCHPREIFVEAINDRAASIMLAHNHPTGRAEPSEADVSMTHNIYNIGRMIGINLFDHVIFTQTDYYSFYEHDRLYAKLDVQEFHRRAS